MNVLEQPGIGTPMNFRLVWMGSDDDSDGNPAAQESAAAVFLRLSGAISYEVRGTEMVRRERLDNGHHKVTPAANFTARIICDVILNDDTAPKREFMVEAEYGGRPVSFRVSAAEFSRMGWVLNKLGPQAIIYPGQQQHARAAIQSLSGSIRQERIFTCSSVTEILSVRIASVDSTPVAKRFEIARWRRSPASLLGPSRACALSCRPRLQSNLRPLWKSLSRGWWLSSPPRCRC